MRFSTGILGVQCEHKNIVHGVIRIVLQHVVVVGGFFVASNTFKSENILRACTSIHRATGLFIAKRNECNKRTTHIRRRLNSMRIQFLIALEICKCTTTRR